ncbi:MAG: dockerin type I repeat-containing protein [Thermodesulfobacteriota bacterium]|nr:dockerin type I repeat-containing protein [Thermodesulfobacteriota bacterium]
MKSHHYFLINVFLVFFFLIISQPALSKVPSGDIEPLGNRDGAVNVGDALVALRFALSLETPTQKDIEHGDVSPLDANDKPCPDGKITVGDALVILRKALGLVNWFYMPDYFPLDSSWETDDWTLFIAQRDKDIDGATAKAMIDTRQPSVTYWTNDENGWRMHGLRDMEVGENNVPIVEFSTPIIFADAVCKIGEKKEGTFNNGKADVNYSIELLAVEDITVPAGSFNNCLKFKLHFYPSAGNPGNYGSETLYLAKGVGFVKGQTDEINGYTDFYYIFTRKGKTRRLLSYHVTKPSDLTVDQHAIKDMYKDSEKYFANENIDNYASALSDNYYDECRNKVTRRAKTEDIFNNNSNIMLFRSPGEIVVNGDKASTIGEWLISGINDSSGKRWWNWGRDRDDFIKESSEWKGYGDQLQIAPSWKSVYIRKDQAGESLAIAMDIKDCQGEYIASTDDIKSLTITGPPGTSIDPDLKKNWIQETGWQGFWRGDGIANATNGFYTFTLEDVIGNMWVFTDYLDLDLAQPLDNPNLVSPINNESIAAGDVTLDWDPVDRATIYRVELSTMPSIYTSDTETVVNLPEGSHSWRVRARRHDLYGWWTGDYDYESSSDWENFSVSSSQ